jgi:ribosomal protein L37AE/L43A
MTPDNKPPACPGCGRRKSVVRAGDLFKCTKCGALFDDDPDEGGDYSDRNPAARIDRMERRRGSANQRRA